LQIFYNALVSIPLLVSKASTSQLAYFQWRKVDWQCICRIGIQSWLRKAMLFIAMHGFWSW